jgi:hypothetical protein
MDIIKKAVKVGNSAGILLPKKLLGADIKITVVNMPLDLKKEALKIADNYLDDIEGIYLLSKKPIEFLAVTNNVKKMVTSSNVRLILMPLSQLKRDIKENEQLRKKLIESEAIINKNLLSILIKESKNSQQR